MQRPLNSETQRLLVTPYHSIFPSYSSLQDSEQQCTFPSGITGCCYSSSLGYRLHCQQGIFFYFIKLRFPNYFRWMAEPFMSTLTLFDDNHTQMMCSVSREVQILEKTNIFKFNYLGIRSVQYLRSDSSVPRSFHQQ